MGAPFTPHDQNKRLIRLATPLGGDTLIPVRVQGQESMSEGFRYEVETFSETRHDIAPHELVGKPLTLVVIQEDGGEGYINGYCAEFEAAGRNYAGQRSGYRLTVVSWLWFLDRRSDCRVFQNETIPDVLQAVVAPLTSADTARADFGKLVEEHPRHRFLVQYNESDYNFLCRLCRREGIAFYTTHENGRHTVHFIDKGTVSPALKPQRELTLRTGTAAGDHLLSWRNRGRFVSGRYTQATYNYNKTTEPLRKDAKVQGEAGKLARAGDMEQYHYTEGYHDGKESRTYLTRQMRLGSERHRVVSGAGTYRFLKVGHVFRVSAVPDGDFPGGDTDFTFTRMELRIDESGQTATPFLAHFEAVPKGELTYPHGKRPAIHSLQTAVVTGRKDKTVHTDHGEEALGRVRVLFHWDREGPADENSGCWLRVMQGSAGAGVSAFYAVPRVGDEVVVAFENGNPDRPFVLGALPNLRNKPPYGKEPTRSGIKTQSFTPGSGPVQNRWNELRFDDKANSEEVYLRAQKDLNCDVENDVTTNVRNNATLNVKNNRTTVIEGGETRDVTKALSVTAGTEISLQVGGNSIVINSSGITITGGAVTINGSPVSIN